ncbi:hypothetical protein [Pseudomonas sp. PA15(2017)]|uniref:hypothetical protein n=1 Tax=Pseudomonas sp. PA15(2017) TaxID=1932111 RepID=UPI0021146C98|nr:hypothetical protein [Pseudomonas sp. PA15(2017)]
MKLLLKVTIADDAVNGADDLPGALLIISGALVPILPGEFPRIVLVANDVLTVHARQPKHARGLDLPLLYTSVVQRAEYGRKIAASTNQATGIVQHVTINT